MRVIVEPEAFAVTTVLGSLLIADARFVAMLDGVVPEPDQVVPSPNSPAIKIAAAPESYKKVIPPPEVEPEVEELAKALWLDPGKSDRALTASAMPLPAAPEACACRLICPPLVPVQ